MTAGNDQAQPSRGRLLLALAAPTALGAAGMVGARSLSVTFWLYLTACTLAPWLLVGSRPLVAGRQGLAFNPRGRPRWPRAWLWLSVLFGPVLLAGYLAVRPVLGSVDAYRERVAALGVDLADPLPAALIFLVLNPLVEEWWWRGQAAPRCCAAFGRRRGLLLATTGFGAYHVVLLGGLFPLPMAILRSTLIASVGLLWSWLSLEQRSWRDAWLAHLAADLAMCVLFALVVLPRG